MRAALGFHPVQLEPRSQYHPPCLTTAGASVQSFSAPRYQRPVYPRQSPVSSAKWRVELDSDAKTCQTDPSSSASSVRHLEGDPLVLPRHEVARRVASDADLRAVAGLSADLVLAVPVPDIAVLQQPAAVRVDVHAVGVVPDAAVGQRVRIRRKKRHSNENFSLHAVDYTKARNCDASPFLWDASPAPQTRVSGP